MIFSGGCPRSKTERCMKHACSITARPLVASTNDLFLMIPVRTLLQSMLIVLYMGSEVVYSDFSVIRVIGWLIIFQGNHRRGLTSSTREVATESGPVSGCKTRQGQGL